jgi:hypothetical protein
MATSLGLGGNGEFECFLQQNQNRFDVNSEPDRIFPGSQSWKMAEPEVKPSFVCRSHILTVTPEVFGGFIFF